MDIFKIKILDYFDSHQWIKTFENQELIILKKRLTTRSDSKKRKTVFNINSEVRTQLKQFDINVISPITIFNGMETYFTSSGIQYFNDVLKEEEFSFFGTQEVLFQPVIRLNNLNSATQSTDLFSFINISFCTKIQSIEDHIFNLNLWIELISAIGIYFSLFEITIFKRSWKRNKLTGRNIFIKYNGLDIGDFILLHNQNDSLFSEVGFGLERLCGVYNNNLNLHQQFLRTPFNNLDMKTLNIMRSLVLIFSQNRNEIYQNNKIKNKVIRMVNMIKGNYSHINLFETCHYYFQYWKYFIDPNKSYHEVYGDIKKNILSTN